MEHTQNTRTALAGLVLIAAAGLASCATAPAPEWGQTPAGHRQLVRASAVRYVEELLDRVDMHLRIVRASADRYVDELVERARTAFCEPSTPEPAPVPADPSLCAAG
jgi:hypothetical protein